MVVAFTDSHGREDHYKLLPHTEHDEWHQSEEALAVAVHSFTASEGDEMSICEGEELLVLHRYRDGWCVAQNEASQIGLVPLNHLKVEEEGEQPPHQVQRHQALATPESREQGEGSTVDKAGPSDQSPSFEELAEIFKALDRNNDGRISHAEFITGLKRNPSIAERLGLPAHIQQEDGTRDTYQLFFGKIDLDDSKSLEFSELCRFYGVQRLDGSVVERQPAASQDEHNQSPPDRTQRLLPKPGKAISTSARGGAGPGGSPGPPGPPHTTFPHSNHHPHHPHAGALGSPTREAGEAQNAAKTQPEQGWLPTGQPSSAAHVPRPPSEPATRSTARRAEEAMLAKIPDPTRADLKSDLVGPPLWSLCSGILPVLREVDTAAADLSHGREKEKERPLPLGGRYLTAAEEEEIDQYIKGLNEESDHHGGGYCRPSSPAQSPHHSPLSPNVHARRAKREIFKRIISQWTKRNMVYAQQHYGGRVVPVACVKLSADAMLLHCPGSVSVAETECHGGAANDRKDGGDGMASERLRSNGWLDTAATVARLELKSMDPVIASIVPDLDDGE